MKRYAIYSIAAVLVLTSSLAFVIAQEPTPIQPNASMKATPAPPAGATQVPARLADGTYVGEIRLFAFEQGPPKGWKECNGDSLVITSYQTLFAVIGNRFGSDQAGRFKLPDLRGAFVRGWDHGAGLDPESKSGRLIPPGGPSYVDGTDHVGTKQNDALQLHKHNDAGHDHVINTAYRNDFACGSQCGSHTIPAGNLLKTNTGYANLSGPVDMQGGTGTRVASETRPANVYLMYCIRDGSPSS